MLRGQCSQHCLCTFLGLVVVFLKCCMLSISIAEQASRLDQIWAILARNTIPEPGRHAVSWTMRLQSIVQAASGQDSAWPAQTSAVQA